MGVELSPALHERVEGLRRQQVRVVVLEPQVTKAALDDIRWLFQGRAGTDMRRLDASNEPREGVVDWLLHLPLNANEDVVVLWPFNREGMMLRFGDFAKYYDDLWYPSSDDVWVTDQARSWLLDVDHEEIFTFFRRPTSDA